MLVDMAVFMREALHLRQREQEQQQQQEEEQEEEKQAQQVEASLEVGRMCLRLPFCALCMRADGSCRRFAGVWAHRLPRRRSRAKRHKRMHLVGTSCDRTASTEACSCWCVYSVQ
jgi:hypothetical protein